MQATTRSNWFDNGQIKAAVVAAAAVTILLLSAALAMNVSSGDQAASVHRTHNAQVQSVSNTRFLERNFLPGDPGTYPVLSQREYRFQDWNILPGDDAGLIPPAGQRGERY